MTAQQFLIALRYRWRTALMVWAATLLVVVLLASLLMPTRYRATSELLIEEANSDPIAGVARPGSSLPSRIMTEADVVRSERVMLRALQAMGNTPYQQKMRARWQSRTGGQGDFNAWLVEQLQRATEVRPSRDSRVLLVSHAASDARFAASFVNALTKAYIETAVDLRVEPARQYSAFFEERARQMREKLHEAQQKASEFYRDNGITTVDEKADVEEARLGQLSAQVVALQAKAEEARRRHQEAVSNVDRMEEILKDPLVVSLATVLSVQEQQLNALTERLGDQHPQVLETRATIAGLRTRLEAAKRRAAAGFEGGSKVSANQLADANRALEAQRDKVLQRKGIREQARLLQNEVDSAQRAFDAVVARLNKTALERSDTQPNVAILKVATVPSAPDSASPAAKVWTGAVAGLLLMLVAIVAIEIRDRRLRNSEDVQSTLNQPLLTVLHRRQPRGAPSPARQVLIRRRPALTHKGIHAAH
jgi:polysaccharide biosynthesis transport protein